MSGKGRFSVYLGVLLRQVLLYFYEVTHKRVGDEADPKQFTSFAILPKHVFLFYHHWCCEFESRPGQVYNIMW